MIQLTIRCLPRVPVSADDVEGWLEHQMGKLRVEAPYATIRLSRLTQGLPSPIGWLIEFELADEERLLAEDHLDEALRDMRLLGLQPTLLAPAGRASPPAALPPGPATNGARDASLARR